MVLLGGIAAFLAAVFLLALRAGLRLSFPLSYETRPVPLENLPAPDLERIEAWGRALEARGYARAGDFRLDLELDPPSGLTQTEQKRVWLSADRTIWAAAKRISYVKPSMEGFARSFLLLGFASRLPSGGLVSTHNSPAADNSFLRDPESSTRVFGGLEDADLLLEAHARHLRDCGAAPEALDADLPAFEQASWRRLSRHAEAQGFFAVRDGRYRATLKLALVSAGRAFNPFRTENGRGPAILARLAALAAATAVAEAVLLEAGAPIWTTVFPFVAAALLACRSFPQTAFFCWIYAMLPAQLLLALRGAQAGWAWLAGTAALLLLLRPLEARRFREVAESLARPDAGPPPLTRRARAVWATAYAAAVLGGAALLVWIRSPKPPSPAPLLAVAALGLGLAGLLLVDVVADFLPSLRRTDARRILRHLARCALVALAGLLGGSWLAYRDERASAVAAAAIVEALESYREAKGSYPAALAELGVLPEPRCGWRPRAFSYRGPSAFGRPDWFTLGWDTARGPAHAWPGGPTP